MQSVNALSNDKKEDGLDGPSMHAADVSTFFGQISLGIASSG